MVGNFTSGSVLDEAADDAIWLAHRAVLEHSANLVSESSLSLSDKVLEVGLSIISRMYLLTRR